jgi:RimJ/RimL family protein N-acetyltransferase
VDTRPLCGLRLRTPRLELRLASRDELVELAHVAQVGIHPRDEMPFYHPWTDRAHLPEFGNEFVAHHEEQLAEWDPKAWALNLITFYEERPVGSQSLRAEDFAATRVADTGSWLGQAFQRQGIGTEMRAAVLEFAFRGLGARAVTSGAMEHNLASVRVSEKLGYREVGEKTVLPRGEPVRERLFRLERGRWRCPIAVEIEGLTPAVRELLAAT